MMINTSTRYFINIINIEMLAGITINQMFIFFGGKRNSFLYRLINRLTTTGGERLLIWNINPIWRFIDIINNIVFIKFMFNFLGSDAAVGFSLKFCGQLGAVVLVLNIIIILIIE